MRKVQSPAVVKVTECSRVSSNTGWEASPGKNVLCFEIKLLGREGDMVVMVVEKGHMC